jgi:hypothetical protein
LEVEIVGRDDLYRFRLLPGYRTHNLGLGDRRTAWPRELWLSDDSMFVELVTTPARFGGEKYWFKCPRSSCARRCAVLYREPTTNARAFTCRHCTPFCYESQLVGRSDRRLNWIAARLTRLDLLPGGLIARPRGMHRRTFDEIANGVRPALHLWAASEPSLRMTTTFLERLESRVTRSIRAEPTASPVERISWRR